MTLPSTPSLLPVSQSVAYEAYMRGTFPSDIQTLMKRRLRVVFEVPETEIADIDFTSLFGSVSKYSCHLSMVWFKTIMNAWTTTKRMHELSYELGCIFGCDQAEDTLRHYICTYIYIYMHHH